MLPQTTATLDVRTVSATTAVIDIRGEITAASEDALTDAYNRATVAGARTILLNFGGLEYMNSSGIGLLVTLLVRANRHNPRQRLQACGLSDHYRQIFELTRLDEAISIFGSEAEALAAGH